MIIGQYMSHSGSGKAANGGTAPSVGTITEYAIRFRSGYSTVKDTTGLFLKQ